MQHGAIQEQQKQLDGQSNAVAEQQRQLAALQAQLEALRNTPSSVDPDMVYRGGGRSMDLPNCRGGARSYEAGGR